MTEDRGELKTSDTLEQGKEIPLSGEAMKTFSVSCWKTYFVLVPTFIAATFLCAFFFTIFVLLFLVGGITLGFCIWWLRWKLSKTIHAQRLGGGYFVIKETRVVKTKTDKLG